MMGAFEIGIAATSHPRGRGRDLMRKEVRHLTKKNRVSESNSGTTHAIWKASTSGSKNVELFE
jgi:hypothetical protein